MIFVIDVIEKAPKKDFSIHQKYSMNRGFKHGTTRKNQKQQRANED